jgi:adenylate cyclase
MNADGRPVPAGLSLDDIRSCLEGVIPSVLATCARDGTPNVTYVSQVHYVDRRHVALSFQFFNKTRENILTNPNAAVFVLDPRTARRYLLTLRYLRTESSGPLFERMKANLAGIASHTGMSGVFKLQGSDVYEVVRIEHLIAPELAPPAPRCNLLGALRQISGLLSTATDLRTLLDDVLAVLATDMAVTHAMILLTDAAHDRLYTVASRGYVTSGVGSEIPLGQGLIGIAARERTPIRITHGTSEYTYSLALRKSAESDGLAELLETKIPLPGLPKPGSQLATPMLVGGRAVGVLFVESEEDARFHWEDEDAFVAVAAQLGMTIATLQQAAEGGEEPSAALPRLRKPRGKPLEVRHYRTDDSVFIGDDYLIKGVAGAIFRKLVADFVEKGRTDFTNRELRLDPRIRLPDITDNLEARLILLVRRLAERGTDVRIEKTGRGRFRLAVERPLTLIEAG